MYIDISEMLIGIIVGLPLVAILYYLSVRSCFSRGEN